MSLHDYMSNANIKYWRR